MSVREIADLLWYPALWHMPANKTKDSHSSLSQRSFNTHRKWCFRPSSPTPIFNNSCLIQNALLIQQFRIKLNYKFTYEIRNLFINAYRCASIYGTHAATNGDMYIVGRSIYFRSMHPIGVNLVCRIYDASKRVVLGIPGRLPRPSRPVEITSF